MKFLLDREYNRLLSDIDEKKDYISPKEIAYLRNEVEYWRGRYEKEHDRADRAVDAIAESAGQMPVSDAGVKQAKEYKSAADQLFDKHQKELAEMFSEQSAEFDDESTLDMSNELVNPELTLISE